MPELLDISEFGDEHERTLLVTGDIDSTSAWELTAYLWDLAGKHITLDLAAVTVIDAAGIHALVQVHRHCEQRGGTLAVRGLPPPVATNCVAVLGIGSVLRLIDAG